MQKPTVTCAASLVHCSMFYSASHRCLRCSYMFFTIYHRFLRVLLGRGEQFVQTYMNALKATCRLHTYKHVRANARTHTSSHGPQGGPYLGQAELRRELGQVPGVADGGLAGNNLALGVDDRAVPGQVLELGNVQPRLAGGDRRRLGRHAERVEDFTLEYLVQRTPVQKLK